MSNNINTGTFVLTNEVLTLTDNMGVRAISILCTSATTGTVEGQMALGARDSDSLTVEQNETVTFVSQSAGVISGLVITAPSGCTLEIIAQS
jgi:proteasome assembly chaperone (PAC2) family protein